MSAKLMFRVMVTSAVVTAVALLAPAANAAESPGHKSHGSQAQSMPGDRHQTSLVLTITEGKKTRSALLQCGPVGGSHPEAVRACGELQAVGGHFKHLGRGGTSTQKCTAKAGPVTVKAQGKWGDRDVNYAAVFPDRCGLQKATGSVFKF